MIHQGLLFIPALCQGNNATPGKWCETWKLAISPLNFCSNNRHAESLCTIWSGCSRRGCRASVCPQVGSRHGRGALCWCHEPRVCVSHRSRVVHAIPASGNLSHHPNYNQVLSVFWIIEEAFCWIFNYNNIWLAGVVGLSLCNWELLQERLLKGNVVVYDHWFIFFCFLS